MTRKLYIIIFVITLFAIIYITLGPVLGQDYYTIGDGPIFAINDDPAQGRLIVSSGQSVYLVSTETGDIISTYPLEDIGAFKILAGSPQDEFIYGSGSGDYGATAFMLDRTDNSVETSVIGLDYWALNILQNDSKLYITCEDRSIGKPGNYDKIIVFDKYDLSLEGIWNCVLFPEYAIYDYELNQIVMAEGMAQSHNPAGGPYIPAGPGIQWRSKVGRYDPQRQGYQISQFFVLGSVSGLAIMSDGAVVVGLADITANDEGAWAATLAVIGEENEYIEIEPYHVIAMDNDSANDRLICTLFNYQNESGGHVLVWDYNTREYNIIHTGLSELVIVKYYDGKLYASNSKDNKIYIIPID